MPEEDISRPDDPARIRKNVLQRCTAYGTGKGMRKGLFLQNESLDNLIRGTIAEQIRERGGYPYEHGYSAETWPGPYQKRTINRYLRDR